MDRTTDATLNGSPNIAAMANPTSITSKSK